MGEYTDLANALRTRLAELTGRAAEELAHDSSANARRVYGLAETGGCPGHGPGPQEG